MTTYTTSPNFSNSTPSSYTLTSPISYNVYLPTNENSPCVSSSDEEDEDPILSVKEEERVAFAYDVKLRQLQQKVTDLTKLYKDSETEAQEKLYFWQNKFVSLLQTLKNQQDGLREQNAAIENEDALVFNFGNRIRSLEDHVNRWLKDQGEQVLSVCRLNKEMLAKLKTSNDEKRVLIGKLSSYKNSYSRLSKSLDQCSNQIEQINSGCNTPDSLHAASELENATEEIARLNLERSQLENNLAQCIYQQQTIATQLDFAEIREQKLANEYNEQLTKIELLEAELKTLREEANNILEQNQSLSQAQVDLDIIKSEITAFADQYPNFDCSLPNPQGITNILDKIQQLYSQLETKNIELRRTNEELLRVRQEIETLSEQFTILKDESITYPEQILEQKNLKNVLTVEVDSLREDLAQTEQTIQKLNFQHQNDMTSIQEKLEKSQQNASDVGEQLNNITSHFNDLKNSYNNILTRNTNLQDENKELQYSLEESLMTLEQLGASWSLQKQNIDKLTGQTCNLKEKANQYAVKLNLALKEKEECESRLSNHSAASSNEETSDKFNSDVSYRNPYFLSQDPQLSQSIATSKLNRSTATTTDTSGFGDSSGLPRTPSLFSSQNYNAALRKGLNQYNLLTNVSVSSFDEGSSPSDSKDFWVRKASYLSVQLKDSTCYWSNKVKQLTLQLEEANNKLFLRSPEKI